MKKFRKQTILPVAIALAVLACAALIVGLVMARRPKQFSLADAGLSEKTDIELTAYHGFCAAAPENSAASFTAAAKNGFDGVLFEVRQTADGIWVVMNDENIRRTTNGTGKVSELTFKQLMSCRINRGSGIRNYRERPLTVPTLSQALSACTGRMFPVIEIRQSGTACLEDLLNEIGYVTRRECRILSADREQLLKIKEWTDSGKVALRSTQVQLYWVTEKLTSKTFETAKQTPDIGVVFNAQNGGNTEKIKSFTDAGISLFACGADKPKLIKELYDAGVRQFATSVMTHKPIETEKTEESSAVRRARPSAAQKKTNTTAKAKEAA